MRKIWQMGILLIAVIFMIGCGREKTDNSNEENSPEAVETAGSDIAKEATESQTDVIEDVSETESDVAEEKTESEPVVKKAGPAVVYMTRDISPEAIIRIYEALGREAKGKVAVKVHMGEPGGENYLKPDLVKDFVLKVKGTFVDCNTAYGGRRTSTEAHMQA